jgi:hypothetical protein
MNRTPKPFALSAAQRSRRAFGKLLAGRFNSFGFGFGFGLGFGFGFDPALLLIRPFASLKVRAGARPLYRGPCAAVRWCLLVTFLLPMSPVYTGHAREK